MVAAVGCIVFIAFVRLMTLTGLALVQCQNAAILQFWGIYVLTCILALYHIYMYVIYMYTYI